MSALPPDFRKTVFIALICPAAQAIFCLSEFCESGKRDGSSGTDSEIGDYMERL
jgi:hypothetical protein